MCPLERPYAHPYTYVKWSEAGREEWGGGSCKEFVQFWKQEPKKLLSIKLGQVCLEAVWWHFIVVEGVEKGSVAKLHVWQTKNMSNEII